MEIGVASRKFRPDWIFEEHLHGEGGSRLGYKLLGILLIFLGILAITGMIGDFMEWILWPVLKYSRQLGEM